MVVVYPKDIERKDRWWWNLETTNLPYWLTAFYSEWDWYLSLYWKWSEIKKLSWLTQSEAECLIIWAISTYDLVISTFYQEWFIYDVNRIDEDKSDL